MDINKILTADYLDILFNGKNKKYGSYELRKKYTRRVWIAVLITFLVIGGVCASTMIKPKEEVVEFVAPNIKDVELIAPPPLEPDAPPPPEITAPPPPVKPTVKFTPPVVVEDNLVKEEDILQKVPEDDKIAIGIDNIEGDLSPDAIDPGLSNLRGDGSGGPVVAPVKEEPKVFTSVQQMPRFPGGDEALRKFFAERVNFPVRARENNITGQVFLEWVVNEDGRVSDIKIMRDIGYGCGEEALRVAKMLPKFEPGRQNGKAVKVFHRMPINFQLQ